MIAWRLLIWLLLNLQTMPSVTDLLIPIPLAFLIAVLILFSTPKMETFDILLSKFSNTTQMKLNSDEAPAAPGYLLRSMREERNNMAMQKSHDKRWSQLLEMKKRMQHKIQP
ncbi:hypothetical protein AXF42_Ash014085 [Apostasia shenzhenica]|uniref:Uncharacterized protein n=1 Tax=Apostasia shenzhenica TaxID=1088818 RepID=A0A2I0A9E8_9ASPA|nr:hypothetical protein AXF42_Ash014085 [Apostasia shenzhenica]